MPNNGKQMHTKGTWETGSTMTRVEVLPEGWNAPLCIADCHTKHAPSTEAERVANARLIAAAPDLLAALESCLSDLHAANPRCVRIAAYRAALRAGGGE